jgi:hypothetical protein
MSYINVQNKPLRAALVTNFLIAELLASQTAQDYQLLLVAPWITNFALTLPVGGDLSALIDSAEAQPYLFDVLRQIADNEGRVDIVVRPETEPRRQALFIEPLRGLTAVPNITIRQKSDLHAKLYVGRHGTLHGSLNLTASGVTGNIEFGAYASDSRTIARLREEARHIFTEAEELRT